MRKNNKGYTLIELIVAMAILAIVVLPLLRGFLISATTNAKARTLLGATTVAENMMEAMKAVGFEQFYKEEQEQITEMAEGVYQWEKTGLILDGKQYRAQVTLDANTYAGETSSSKYNETPLIDIYNMDTRQDAFYVETSEAREKVLEYYKTALKQGTSLPSNFESTLRRTLKVSVVATGNLNGEYTTKIKITSTYDTTSDQIETTKKQYTEFEDYTIYDSSQTQGQLRGIYLFYAPIYGATTVSDYIIIENLQEIPVTCYVVKQKQEGITTNLEELYRANVTVREKEGMSEKDRIIPEDPGWVWNTTSGFLASTEIVSNLNWYVEDVSQKLPMKQATVVYQRLGAQESGEKAEGNTQFSGMIKTSSKERLYDVNIGIYYEGDDGDLPTIQMEGTILK